MMDRRLEFLLWVLLTPVAVVYVAATLATLPEALRGLWRAARKAHREGPPAPWNGSSTPRRGPHPPSGT